MKPLDLSQRPPRGCRDSLEGLALIPRTIDKIRSQLPGGNPGNYILSVPQVTGLSIYVLKRLGITEEQFADVVASAPDEAAIAQWLREHTDSSKWEAITGSVTHLRPRHAEDPQFVLDLYKETLAEHPELEFMVDIVDADDRRIFGG